MSRGKWILIAIAALVVVIGWRLLHRNAGPAGDDEADAPVPVTVVPAAAENVPVYLSDQGTVRH